MDFLHCHIEQFVPKEFEDSISQIATFSFDEQKEINLNPGGYFELVFQSGGFQQKKKSAETWYERPRIFVGGLHSESFAVRPTDHNGTLISVQFKTGKAKNFIPDRLNLYKDGTIPLTDIFGADLAKQAEEVFVQNSNMAKVRIIQDLLQKIHVPKIFSAIDRAVELILEKNGCLAVQDLAYQVHLGPSQFRKRFNEEVGMSPKAYSKIVRINAIQNALLTGKHSKLTELAYYFDYFDQSHFVRDFKSVIGWSPKQYLKALKMK